MLFLDTNAVIWLYQGELDKFTDPTKRKLEQSDILISPLVKLELQYLYEVKRITEKPEKVIEVLYDSIGIQEHNVSLNILNSHALAESWTRDPFDRLITCHARIEDAFLVTRDEIILKNYKMAIW